MMIEGGAFAPVPVIITRPFVDMRGVAWKR
jgi:hypothetical protein